MDIDVGQVIAGKYELVRLLGKGAMGEVWLANHTTLGGQFAIKLIEPTHDAEAESAGGRFQLEAQIAAKLSRKTRHIVSVSDHGEENGLAYLVMELLEGESLEARLTRGGPLQMPEVAAMVSQIARALTLAHEEGIFHRDLKPANVWLGRDEDGRLVVKLLDFGIARSLKPFRTRSPFVTSKDMVLGTPCYMSPEQARGLDTLDYRCDLWALAVVAYEALTTAIPFDGATIEDVFLAICTFRLVPIGARRRDLPPGIEEFFARAFAPNIAQRFSSAAELTESFELMVPPEQLEAALGAPMTSANTRRLDAERARRASQPELGNLGELGSMPTLGSHPNLAPASSSALVARGAAPGSSPDFQNGGLRDALPPRRSHSTTWVIAGVAIIALLGIGSIVVASLRGPRDSSADTPTRSVDAKTANSNGALSALPSSPEPSPLATAATATAPSALTLKTAPGHAKPSTTARPAASATGADIPQVVPPPPAPSPPPPVVPAKPAKPPAPAPAPEKEKRVDKSELF